MKRCLMVIAFGLCLMCFGLEMMWGQGDRALVPVQNHPVAQVPTMGDYHLLAIGINQYADPRLRLRTAVNDARMVAEVLKERWGFEEGNITLLLDGEATDEAIERELRRLARDTRAADAVLIYFAGHGHLDDITDEGSWIPVNASFTSPSRWVSNARVRSLIRAMPARAEFIAPVSITLGKDTQMQLIWIAPGEFILGSPVHEEGRFENEGPQTRVRFTKGFWLGKYPVTQGQWQALMASNPSYFKESGLDAPVENISWNQANDFVRRLNEQERLAGRLPEGYIYSLPSEAQWEFAARAGTTTRFHTGNAESDLARAGWFEGNSGGRTQPVGQKVPNAWGLYDMLGNVYEWTRSHNHIYPGGTVVDYVGRNWDPDSVVARGGSSRYPSRFCRSANRTTSPPFRNYNDIGFRVALISRY